MIRAPHDARFTVTTTYAHVRAVATLPGVRYREREGRAYAVRYVPTLGRALVYTAPLPASAEVMA